MSVVTVLACSSDTAWWHCIGFVCDLCVMKYFIESELSTVVRRCSCCVAVVSKRLNRSGSERFFAFRQDYV